MTKANTASGLRAASSHADGGEASARASAKART